MKYPQMFNSVNLVIMLFLLCLGLVRPDVSVLQALRTWHSGRAERAKIGTLWPSLTSTGARIGQAADHQAIIVEFTDYECPFCRLQNQRMSQSGGSNAGAILVIRHYPLPIHPGAAGAARASICAERQGYFEAMHTLLFEEVERWRVDTNWQRLAEEAQVADIAAFLACLHSGATTARLALDMAMGDSLGIAGTPTFVAHGGLHLGLQDSTALTGMASTQ